MEFEGNQEYSFGGGDPSIVGAIFMANRRTKMECLNRKLFGLPSSEANFVKRVKSGMMLFLFNYEERKLYGVFQAVSDGAMNIVPNAFKSFGKQIPAQIRIKTIWYCKPLSECEFRGAIKENYFAAYKFNLGLSKDQVAKLLWLFDSRKIQIQKDKSLSMKDFTKKSESPLSERSSKNLFSEKKFTKKFKSLLPKECMSNRSVSSDNIFEDNEDIPSDCEPVSLNKYYGSSRSNSNLSSVSEKPDSFHSSADVLFPSSKTIVVPFQVAAENLNLPPMRSSSLDVAPSFGDYIPLKSAKHIGPIHSSTPPPQCPPSRYDSISFSEPALDTVPSSRHVSIGRENVMLSLGPGKDPPYVPDHYCPAILRESSLLTVTSSRHAYFGRENVDLSSSTSKDPPYVPDYHYPANVEREKPSDSANQPSAADPSFDSENIDFYQNPLENKQTSVEKDLYEAHGGMRSDIQNQRTSVFFRLNGCPKDLAQDDKKLIGTKDHAGKTVKQLMDLLSECQKHWRKSTKKYEPNIKWNGVDDKVESEIILSELDDAPLDIEDQECTDVIVGEPVVNFKRRSKVRKMLSEMEHRMEETDGLSNTCLPKRRKLVRPSFVKVEEGASVESFMSSSNMQDELIRDSSVIKRHRQGVTEDSQENCCGDGNEKAQGTKFLNKDGNGKIGNTEESSGSMVLEKFVNKSSESEGNMRMEELFPKSNVLPTNFLNGGENNEKVFSGMQSIVHALYSGPNSGKTDLSNRQDQFIQELYDIKDQSHLRLHGLPQDVSVCWEDVDGKAQNRRICCEDVNSKAQDSQIWFQDANKDFQRDSGSIDFEIVKAFFPESSDRQGNPSIENSDLKLKRKEMCEEVCFGKSVDSGVIDLNLSIGSCYNSIS